ncbi:ADP-ribosyl cyclase/cyclic ADP-ribose hydrolase 1-like [Pseudoliparis swirei]|uniref:ADP-ribosyl cyclase/cyclic ADP-ribose hydrolase 1-like n=1 Tax=Pseudoliparis swirei TaxID=2059687 RepID=UPI0024BD5F6B|nr:ADP-ribosyl cyclase/cyclic ADP-ribose hydrolase 1-like [Pseudoliparis swirei]
MERGVTRSAEKRRRRRRLFLGAFALLLVVVVILAVLYVVGVGPKEPALKPTFMERCEAFKGYECEDVWNAFQLGYVGKDPCGVTHEAYDPLMVGVPFRSTCNRLMFWSKTKDVVHNFTKESSCYVTVEETLLGSVLDGLTWCGKEGSNETFTTGCPGWTDCENNPVRSFWNRVSADFADSACGDVAAMLNGSIATPFHPDSVFASNEVKRFHFPRVKRLQVVLVSQENSATNCTNASLKNLQKELDPKISYECREVTEADLHDCSARPKEFCGNCW